MALAAGLRLGPYEIVSALGAGGMGEVFRARDTRLGREVALKVLPEAFSSDPVRLQRFEQEARAVAALNHPNILSVYDVGKEGATHFIATELLEGTTLREKLVAGALPPRRAIECAEQIAHGLAAAHDKGIVHRDLKPENLFVTREGRIKILDFGLAKQDAIGAAGSESAATMSGVQTTPGMVLGTVGYMSPEQVKGRSADARSDIFAFGAVLYEMLSGRRAFQRNTSAETMTAILNEDPPELSSNTHTIAPAYERIVRRCLEKDAEHRFQSAKDLGFALEAVTGSTTSAARVDGARPRARIRTVVAALVVVAAVIGTAGLMSYFRPAAAPIYRYHRISYSRGAVINARFAPDGETIVYTAAWEGKPKSLYTVRKEFPDSRPVGVPGANLLLAVSSLGELAVLVGDHYLMHFEYVGTLATMPLGGGAPREIAEDVHAADFAPDGKSLAVVRHLGDRETLEYPIGTVLVSTAGWMSHPHFSPDGKSIGYLVHPINGDDRGYVEIVDIGTRKTTRLTPEYESLQPMAWAPEGKQIWFSAAHEGSTRHMHSVDLSAKIEERMVLPTGADVLDISQDGRLLMRTDSIASVVTVYLPDGTERDLPYLDFDTGPILTRDGKRVIFSDNSERAGKFYEVMMRSVDGSPAARLGEGNAMGVSADGKWVLSVVYSEPPKIMLLPTGAGTPRELGRGNIAHYQNAGFFPDGKRVLFTGDEPGKQSRCYVQDLDGLPQAITPEGYSVVFDPVAPDGRSFVARGVSGQLVLFPIAGGAPAKIPNTTHADWPVGWSSDSDHLYFYVTGEVNTSVYKLDVHTGQRTVVRKYQLRDPVGIATLTWIGSMTPDGKMFAFAPRRELNDIYVAEREKK